jgi:hypothetical protein
MDRQAARRRIVYLLAAALMVLRVDLWWWGEPTPPILFGWLTAPMLYQLGVWAAGYALVIYTARVIWPAEDRG